MGEVGEELKISAATGDYFKLHLGTDAKPQVPYLMPSVETTLGLTAPEHLKGAARVRLSVTAADYNVDQSWSEDAPSSEEAKHMHFMSLAIEEAYIGPARGEGGPFGAVIVDKKTGSIVARGHNMVLQNNDPTAHAEVTVIRKACSKLGTFSLDNCILYTSCEPCPMCLGATHWAKIPEMYYSATADDAAEGGFDDRFIYDVIRGTNKEVHVKSTHLKHPEAVKPFKKKYGLY